jgi:RNA polymerase sigma-70 factor (ECF subfamily)
LGVNVAVRADDVDLVRDRSLVELCQAGDHRAFGDLYDRYYARLLRFCMRRVGNAHEAEEITQEAFARAFTAMPRFAGERRFYPWLTVIASRLCIDSHRRAARSEPSADVDLGGVEGGQQQILDNVDLAYLAQAMEQLGPRHREVLELRETHGWSYQQIADHYSVTMGTVEALLFRARKALKREFLAIAGSDHRLASIPLLGALYRGLGVARARLHDLSHQALPVACAGAAGVAAVAGGLVLHHDTSAAPVVRTPHVVRADASKAPAVVESPAVAAEPAVEVPASPTQISSGSPAPQPVTYVGGNAADGRARTQTDSSALDIAGFKISTDFTKAGVLLNGEK